jgi:tetratricopeptide (TPR) repeat protein
MKLHACLSPLLAIVVCNLAQAQGGPNPDPELTRPNIVLSGKVVLDDGNPVPGVAAVQTLCKGQKRTVAHTDPSGRFSFTLVEQASSLPSIAGGGVDASVGPNDGLPIGDSPSPLHNRRQWRECSVLAELPGFTSEPVDIISRTDNNGGNIGSIVIHRIANVQGLTVSATSAAAPEEAKKLLEKGYEQEKKERLNTAFDAFQKAVDIYPQYAVAWFELGRINLAKGDVVAAKQAFSKSLEADSHYVSPYLGLAQIALQQQRWQELADLSAKVVQLNPISFPNAWLFNGYANYYLGRMADAEKSALEGLKIDPDHHVPKLEYLLGMILLDRKDYSGASVHMQNFLHAVSDPREIAEAKKQLAQINHLAETPAASVPEKK